MKNYIMIAMLIIMSMSVHAQDALAGVDDATAIAAALDDEYPEEPDVASLLEEDIPRGLGVALTQIRYALARNPEAKEELGLRLANMRLVRAAEAYRERDMARAEAELARYERLSDTFGQAQRALPEQIEFQKRVELHYALTAQMHADASFEEESSSEQVRLKEQARNAAERAQRAYERTEERVRLAHEQEGGDLDMLRAEAELRIRGEAQSGQSVAHAFIASVARRIIMTESVLDQIENEQAQPLREELENSKNLLREAREALETESYEEAREFAVQSRELTTRIHARAQTLRPEETDEDAEQVGFRYNAQNREVLLVSGGVVRERVQLTEENLDAVVARLAERFDMSEEEVRARLGDRMQRMQERLTQTGERVDEVGERIQERLGTVTDRLAEREAMLRERERIPQQEEELLEEEPVEEPSDPSEESLEEDAPLDDSPTQEESELQTSERMR